MEDLDQPIRITGEDWEDRVLAALRLRYQGGQLTELRSQLGGDGGLEAYSHDGLGYQCFVARDAQTMRDCTDKQKRKVTRDTAELQKYEALLVTRLGGMRLRRWVLVVPEWYSSELIDHCNERADTVVGWGLAIIDADDFRIIVHDENEYRPELQRLVAGAGVYLDISLDEPRQAEVDELAASKTELVKVLEGKLKDVVSDPVATRDFFLNAFVRMGHVMSQLEEWPETYETVEEQRRTRERMVEAAGHLDPPDARTMLTLITDYSTQLRAGVPAMTREQAESLSTGTVAEWLMRCPLRPVAR